MRPRNKTYKRKSKKNKTYKKKSYKKRSYRKNPSRKNKKSKRIRKSRRSFIKKIRTNKSKGKRMVGGATSATLTPEEKQLIDDIIEKNPNWRDDDTVYRFMMADPSLTRDAVTKMFEGREMLRDFKNPNTSDETKTNAAAAFKLLRQPTAKLTMAQALNLIRKKLGITDHPKPGKVVERAARLLGRVVDPSETLHQQVQGICEELDIQTNWRDAGMRDPNARWLSEEGPNYKLNETYVDNLTQPSD